MKKTILILAALGGLATSAGGGEFKPGQVPVNAQWFLHVNVTGFKKTQLGKFGLEQAKEFEPFINGFAKMIQFDPRKDLYGITAFGTMTEVEGEVQAKGTVLVNGKFNPVQMLALLLTQESIKQESVQGHNILSWVEDGNRSYGAFAGRTHLLIGDDRALLLNALQVLRGRAPSLKPDPLAGLKIEKGNHFILQAQLKGLPIPPEAKVLEKVHSIGITVGEFDQNLVATSRVTAADEETAILIQQSIQGLLAIGQLQLSNTTEPELKEVEALLKKVTLTQKKNTVVTSLSVPVEKILKFARDRLPRK
jgi:hypothetical protein